MTNIINFPPLYSLLFGYLISMVNALNSVVAFWPDSAYIGRQDANLLGVYNGYTTYFLNYQTRRYPA